MIKRNRKNKLERIKEIDWFLYLTRPLDIFSFVCNGLAYKKIKYVGQIKNVGYLYDNKLVNYYRSKKEFEKNINILRANIINFPEKIENELRKGIEVNKEAQKIIKKYSQENKLSTDKREIKYLVKLYIDLFTYGTVFPYLVGLALEKTETKKIKALVNKLRLVSYYTDFKNKVLNKNFSQLSNDKKVKNTILSFDYTPDDFFAFLEGKKLKKIIGKFYFFILGDDVINGNDEKIFKEIKNNTCEEKNKKKSEIKGTVAYPGIVTGRAKIVYGEKDFIKFNEGDILITINSNPSLMTVIKKCKAIVSDEGGMMCHAAIVAREMKKPCVVGTKIATQVLKDGDMVEVDADNGVVKILNKK